jgi:hypothetical protein
MVCGECHGYPGLKPHGHREKGKGGHGEGKDKEGRNGEHGKEEHGDHGPCEKECDNNGKGCDECSVCVDP